MGLVFLLETMGRRGIFLFVMDGVLDVFGGMCRRDPVLASASLVDSPGHPGKKRGTTAGKSRFAV
jgi:hypothetical protein